ncbi:TIGR01440 family protein [Bacillus sp. C1-1]|nr:TIGR01440 family protein [Bacillus sp. C1-1]
MKIEERLIDGLHAFHKQVPALQNKLFVIGVSTSEIAGKPIGKEGSMDIAEELYRGFVHFQKQSGVHLVFQCCEHLNRALVMERSIAEQKGLTEVSAIPVRHAGGAMATYAYRQLQDPVLVESVQADAGMDIGDTFIGMHIKPVLIPIRIGYTTIGSAHVTVATSRPRLIGGERAQYKIGE